MSDVSGKRALLIGNSDGIGRAFTRRLLDAGWLVSGLSRSELELPGAYRHEVCDVTSPGYPERLAGSWDARGPFDLVVHCVGIGSGLDEAGWGGESLVVRTNLVSLVQVVETLVPRMLLRGRGHLIGLSSLADVLHVPGAPSYCSSKAGYSHYLRSLSLRLRPRGLHVTNVRFGFVDTKMARAGWRPRMVSAEIAASVLLRCVRRRPVQLSYPKSVAALVRVARWLQDLRACLS